MRRGVDLVQGGPIWATLINGVDVGGLFPASRRPASPRADSPRPIRSLERTERCFWVAELFYPLFQFTSVKIINYEKKRKEKHEKSSVG